MNVLHKYALGLFCEINQLHNGKGNGLLMLIPQRHFKQEEHPERAYLLQGSISAQ